MKSLILQLSILFTANSFLLANVSAGVVLPEEKCSQVALQIAKQLDQVYVQFIGTIQGDYDDESQMPVTVKLVSEKLVPHELDGYQDYDQVYQVEIGHTNEDLENWSHLYQVVLRKSVFEEKSVFCPMILEFSLIGQK